MARPELNPRLAAYERMKAEAAARLKALGENAANAPNPDNAALEGENVIEETETVEVPRELPNVRPVSSAAVRDIISTAKLLRSLIRDDPWLAHHTNLFDAIIRDAEDIASLGETMSNNPPQK